MFDIVAVYPFLSRVIDRTQSAASSRPYTPSGVEYPDGHVLQLLAPAADYPVLSHCPHDAPLALFDVLVGLATLPPPAQ